MPTALWHICCEHTKKALIISHWHMQINFLFYYDIYANKSVAFLLFTRKTDMGMKLSQTCNLSVLSTPLFNRTSTSSADSILTDATSARMRCSSHSMIAVSA